MNAVLNVVPSTSVAKPKSTSGLSAGVSDTEIDDVIVDNVEVEIVNGLIAVSNTANIEVLLFDVNGRVIDRKNGNGNTIYFEVPVSGSYMLRVGNLLTKKVVVIR